MSREEEGSKRREVCKLELSSKKLETKCVGVWFVLPFVFVGGWFCIIFLFADSLI